MDQQLEDELLLHVAAGTTCPLRLRLPGRIGQFTCLCPAFLVRGNHPAQLLSETLEESRLSRLRALAQLGWYNHDVTDIPVPAGKVHRLVAGYHPQFLALLTYRASAPVINNSGHLRVTTVGPSISTQRPRRF